MPLFETVTGEFPAQMASDAENISIWRRHHIEPIKKLQAKKTHL